MRPILGIAPFITGAAWSFCGGTNSETIDLTDGQRPAGDKGCREWKHLTRFVDTSISLYAVSHSGRVCRSKVRRRMAKVKPGNTGSPDAELSVDVDGALSLVLRLADGRLMLAELAVDGSLALSRYDDDFRSNEKHLPNAAEADFINHLF